MIGAGTLINTLFIMVGGVLGYFFGKLLKENIQNTLIVACGVSTMFIGMSGAFEGMLSFSGGRLIGGKGVFVVICLVLGGLVGEILKIEDRFEHFGEFLKEKTNSSKDENFVNAFLTATFTVCIGAMAVVGSIEDGLTGDFSILLTKAILDLIIIMVMTASLGKGAIYSFIPVFFLQGIITLLAKAIESVFSDMALSNLSMVGSVLIFCVGLNLVWGKKVKVANFLPAIIFAVAFTYLPIPF